MAHIITISGELGSGKSTVARLLAQKLGYQYYSTGSAMRQIADQRGITILELNKLCETDKTIDAQIDAIFAKLVENKKNYVVDSRLAYHFIPDSFKVKLVVDVAIAGVRILHDTVRTSEAHYVSAEEVIENLKKRRASETERFLDLYHIDINQNDKFDLVLDTAKKTPEELTDIINIRNESNKKGLRIVIECKKGINPDHELCKYKNSEQVEFKGKRYNHGGCREVIFNGKIFETPADIAEELGLHPSTVSKWAKRGYAPNGVECRYTDDKSVHVFKRYVKGEKIRKPIYVNGILYESKAAAERSLGLCKGYLAPYIAGTRKNNKYNI